MKRKLLIPALSLICISAGADSVTDWNSIALDAIRVNKTPPPVAARNLAILHTAIFDACNGIGQNYQPYFVTDKPAGVASKEAAITAAAREVLDSLFPTQQTNFEAAYRNRLAEIPGGRSKSAGISWGESVAAAILQWRAHDGSDETVGYTPGSGPGVWIPTPPGFLPALLPNWPLVTCFALNDGSQFRPPPPPALDSAQWAFDFNLTKGLGRFDSATRTPEQTEIALFWADGAGTVTPPGHWNVIAREIANRRGNTLDENARLFALLNIAEADAGIAAWDCKYAYNFWRPVTAIQNADTDGNPDTTSDATWTPLITTPNFPEYISGHSTFSGAAAAALAAFYGSDDIPFTTGSDALPGTTRSFNFFSEAAAEAGISRVYGGIHFMSANEHGLLCGAQVGGYVVKNFLRPRPGKSQRGH
jgi:membrane-associated phospholipid phosphatase